MAGLLQYQNCLRGGDVIERMNYLCNSADPMVSRLSLPLNTMLKINDSLRTLAGTLEVLDEMFP
jgi:hypothetical protein